MKIKQQSFYFSLIIFLSAIIFADPVQIDFQMKNNINDTTDVFFSHKDINGTSVAIPFDMLRHTKNGGVFLNTNGYDGDDFDDQSKKKPRPYFGGDSLWLGNFEDLRGKISDLLDYIELMLNNPEKELTSSQLASALDELEALSNERHRRAAENQQDVTENLLRNSTLDNWRFTHYPGYQKYHPAHPHHETYIVPGILETPREKGGGDSQKAPSNTDSGAASLPSPDTNLMLGKRTSKGSSDEDDPRQPKKPRDDKNAKSECPKEKQTETVEKEIEVDGKKYTITSELSGIDLDLICMICFDLAGLDGEKCGKCYKHICLKDYNKYLDGKKEALCPSCQSFQLSSFTADPDEMKYKINHLQWFCPKGCGATRDLINIESHIRHCNEEYECENQGCEFEGSYSEVKSHECICDFLLVKCRHEGCQKHYIKKALEEHELTCKWQLVNVGPARFCMWEKEMMDEYYMEIPDGATPENIQDKASFLVTLLVNKVHSMSPPEECDDIVTSARCNGCHNRYSSKCIDAHKKECDQIETDCDYCGIIKKRAELKEHYLSCKKYLISCAIEGCDYAIARESFQELNKHEHDHCLSLNGIEFLDEMYLPDAESVRYVSISGESYLISLPGMLSEYSWETGIFIPKWNLLIILTAGCGKQHVCFGKLENKPIDIAQNILIKLYSKKKLVIRKVISRFEIMGIDYKQLFMFNMPLFSIEKSRYDIFLKILLSNSRADVFAEYESEILSYRKRVKKIIPE